MLTLGYIIELHCIFVATGYSARTVKDLFEDVCEARIPLVEDSCIP